LLLLLLLNALDAKSENYESPHALSRGPYGSINKGGAVSPSFLNPPGFEEYKGTVYSLLLELAEMEFWPAFV
jgi:hypothetical protein